MIYFAGDEPQQTVTREFPVEMNFKKSAPLKVII